MIRALLVTVGVFATLLVLAECLVVGMLWSRGNLTAQSLQEIRLALSGRSRVDTAADESAATVTLPSEVEIREARIRRVLEIEARETELSLLKRMTTETANRLIADRQAYDEVRADLRAELERLREQTISEATEQTRAVLLSSPPEEAVTRLMGLTVTEGVDLLRGLPEKAISRILQAFAADPKTTERGQTLFEGLYRGDPQRTAIENAARELDGRLP